MAAAPLSPIPTSQIVSLLLFEFLHLTSVLLLMQSFSASYDGERPWWPTQSLNKGRKKKAKGQEEKDQIKFIDLKFER